MHIMSFFSYNGYKLNSHLTCFQRGFTAQLVEFRTGIAEVMGSNPIEVSECFLGYLCNCLSCVTTAKITLTSILYHKHTMHTLYIFPPVNYDSIGCYQDGKPRAFSTLVINLRGKLNWSNMNETIYKCAQHVRHAGFTWFALHYYGECWSGKDAGKTYNRHGRSVECWEGVGKEKANFVYRLKA